MIDQSAEMRTDHRADTTHRADKTHDRFQLERLAFFSDAVFAIAITLLVIEVRLPETAGESDAALAAAFVALIPNFIGFAVSFFVIGRFWIGHHRVIGHLRTCDDRLVWLNLLFLLTIAFMPFPTSVISEYGGSPLGVGFYAGWLTLSGLLYRHMLAYSLRSPALVNRHDPAAPREILIHSAWAPIVIGGLALPFALYNPLLALIPLIASPLIVRGINRLASRIVATPGAEVAAGD